MCNERLAEIEKSKLLDVTQREERLGVVVGGLGSEGLAFGSAIVNLLVVNIHGLTPGLIVTDRAIRPHVDKRDKCRFVRPRLVGVGRTAVSYTHLRAHETDSYL
eukprot:1925071-Pleurochrysis_carterae.AAC.1